MLVVTVIPLGRYMAAVYGARRRLGPGDRFFAPVERLIYRVLRVDPRREQRWNVYAISLLLAFSVVSFLFDLRCCSASRTRCRSTRRTWSPSPPFGAFNVAVSFMTNTNWQWYCGELTMSHLTQMLGLTVQNFVSAAAGMAVAVAIIRGITRRGRRTLGNFWVDLVRTTLRILLPLSFVVADPAGRRRRRPEPHRSHGGDAARPGRRRRGQSSRSPVARSPARSPSSSSAPTAAASSTPTRPTRSRTRRRSPNFLEIWAILVIPFAFVVTYGRLVGSKRQARVLLAVMAGIWLAMSRC